MAYFTTTLETRASAEATFLYLADFSNAEDWDPNVTRARRISEPPLAEGTRFELFLPLAGRELRFEYQIVRYEPHQLVVLEADNAWLRSLDTIRVERRLNGGARVEYDADLRPRGLAYLFDLPLHLAFQVAGMRSTGGLARALARLGHAERALDAGAELTAEPEASPEAQTAAESRAASESQSATG